MFTILVEEDNTHLLCKGKYHRRADLLFYWFGFNQTSKYVTNSASAKHLNPNTRKGGHTYWMQPNK